MLNKDYSTTSRIEVSKKHLQKHQQHSRSKPSSNVSFEPIDNLDSASSDSEPEPSVDSECPTHTKQLSTTETPAFVGQHVTDDNTKSKKKKEKSDTSTSSNIQQILTFMNKFESKYLKPLLVKQEKTEATLKCLYTNQKKMQSTLRKQKVT